MKIFLSDNGSMDPFPQKETGVKMKMYSGIQLQSTVDCLLLDSGSRGRVTGHILAKLLHTFD